jgi:class 3 adenylate cyclase/tetratricopeptide (TPR) repeat protein
VATLQEIENAISVIETQQSQLDSSVVDVSLTALREKLAELRDHATGEQHPNVTVLVADLSGFTAMSELRDAEEVRDTMNALWQKLDSVITSWGGKVDKHVGDAVIALFGMPKCREDDPERAVQAALDMQLELALFNERARFGNGVLQYSRSSRQAQLRMRIGIHNGSVFMGAVGSSKGLTAVGDTVNLANQLEKNAPVEGILISEDMFQQVQDIFEVISHDPIVLKGRSRPEAVYVVRREKARPFYMSIRGIEGIETRIVGRNQELEMLQDTLLAAIDGSMSQVVTVLGESGVGKSRLIYEFERLMAVQPEKVSILRGRVQREMGQQPYSLFRDLLANHFDIHRRNSPAVAREKFMRGVFEIFAEDTQQTRKSAQIIGHLLGFDYSQGSHLKGIVDDPRRLRELAFKEMASLFSAIARQEAGAVLLLEDLHRGDEGSFDLLDYLVTECAQEPLLFVCIARPTLLKKRPSYQMVESLNEGTYQRIELPALNMIDSRHLAMDILQHVRQLPFRLLDMIVNRGRGNPFITEELVSLLIEFEVIVPAENRWQIQLINLPEMPVLPTLADMVRLRLTKLSELEQKVLQQAAVSGRLFWDAMLVAMIQADDDSIADEEILEALYSLELKDWIYRRKLSTFSEVQEYAFRHDSLSSSIYTTLPSDKQQQAHQNSAHWLIGQNGRDVANHAAVIAHHFERADDLRNASDWYQQAAIFAQNAYMPETAIEHFQHALRLLQSDSDTSQQRVEIYAGLGDMLQKQARFEAAIDAFNEMKSDALRMQNHAAELQAYRSLMLAYGFSGDFRLLLQISEEAEKVARAMNAREDTAFALAGQAWAFLASNQVNKAVQPGRESVAISSEVASTLEMAFSHAVLANIGRVAARYEQALKHNDHAQRLFQQQGERLWEAIMLANAGYISQAQGDNEKAQSYYLDCLQIARDIGDYFTAVLALRHLGRIKKHKESYAESRMYYQQALLFAEKSGNTMYRAGIARELGELYFYWSLMPGDEIPVVEIEGYIQQAYMWLERAVKLGREAKQPAIVAQALIDIARLLLGDEAYQDALNPVFEAIELMESASKNAFDKTSAWGTLALAWRTLALVTMQLSDAKLPVEVQSESVMPSDCLEKSATLFGKVGRKGVSERIKTLEIWADYEGDMGNAMRQAALLREVENLRE